MAKSDTSHAYGVAMTYTYAGSIFFCLTHFVCAHNSDSGLNCLGFRVVSAMAMHVAAQEMAHNGRGALIVANHPNRDIVHFWLSRNRSVRV